MFLLAVKKTGAVIGFGQVGVRKEAKPVETVVDRDVDERLPNLIRVLDQV